MPKQQPASVVAPQEDIEDFLIFVLTHDYEIIGGMLQENPTLINAVNEIGDTAINSLIHGDSTEEDLEFVRFLMSYNPDLNIENDGGFDAFTSLQLLPNAFLLRKFAKTLKPDLEFRQYSDSKEDLVTILTKVRDQLKALLDEDEESDQNSSDSTATTKEDADLKELDDYCEENQESIRDLDNLLNTKPSGSNTNGKPSSTTVFNLHKIEYNNPGLINSLFSYKNPFMDPIYEQKQFNQIESMFGFDSSSFEEISFTPNYLAGFSSVSGDLQVIVAPKDILAFFDKAEEILTGLSNYFFSISEGDSAL